MRTTIKLLAVLALALATFGQHTAAQSASLEAGERFNYKFKGLYADANFYNLDASGCIETYVSISAGEEVVRSVPSPEDARSFIFYTVYQYDYCTDTDLHYGYGFELLASSDFKAATRLESATLNTSFFMYDWVTEQNLQLFVNLTWTATGPLGRDISHSHSSIGNCSITRRSNSTFRSAEASGTVSTEDGTINFTPEPSYYGFIVKAKSGEVGAICN